MATVLERFVALGLEHNRKILSKTGMRVSDVFLSDEDIEDRPLGRVLKKQTEEGKSFDVWDYPKEWVESLDRVILDFVQNPFTDA